MNVTMEQLLQLIGEQQVELALLRREVARLTAEAKSDTKTDKPSPTGPRAVEAH